MLHSIRVPHRPGGRRAPLIGLLALVSAGASACDVPTELPQLETTWVVPAENTTIAVGSLLPAGITVSPAGDAFVLDLGSASFDRSLGDVCQECKNFDGLIIPIKPEFTADLGSSVDLPGDVVSASIAGGEVRTQIRNGFSFDPLRPEGTSERGYIVITATSGNTLLTRDSISGNNTQFQPGTTLTRTLPLNPASVSGPIAINVRIFSPQGGPIRVNTNERVTVVAQPNDIRVSQAQVRVDDQRVDAEQVELDTDEVDDEVVDRLRGGALLLDIDNPFGVTGNLTLNIAAPGTTITKQIQLQAARSAVRVPFTGQEIQAILGSGPVLLDATGTLSATGGAVTVRPNQSVSIRSRLELTIGPKEG
jgi:hypothetical protein